MTRQLLFINGFIKGGTMLLYKLAAKLLQYQFVKFIFVGGVNTLFGLLAYIIFLQVFGVDKGLALVATYAVGIIFNFFSIGVGVFKKIKITIFFPFICNYICLYIVNYLLLSYLVGRGISAVCGQVILVLPMALLSFFVLKIIFSKIE